MNNLFCYIAGNYTTNYIISTFVVLKNQGNG